MQAKDNFYIDKIRSDVKFSFKLKAKSFYSSLTTATPTTNVVNFKICGSASLSSTFANNMN